jgi:hypothetical protein
MTQYREEEAYPDYVIRTSDEGVESWIPKDEANSDYQAYLKSLES